MCPPSPPLFTCQVTRGRAPSESVRCRPADDRPGAGPGLPGCPRGPGGAGGPLTPPGPAPTPDRSSQGRGAWPPSVSLGAAPAARWGGGGGVRPRGGPSHPGDLDLLPAPSPMPYTALTEPPPRPQGGRRSFHETRDANCLDAAEGPGLLPAHPPAKPVLEQKVPLSQPSTRATSSPQLSPRRETGTSWREGGVSSSPFLFRPHPPPVPHPSGI